MVPNGRAWRVLLGGGAALKDWLSGRHRAGTKNLLAILRGPTLLYVCYINETPKQTDTCRCSNAEGDSLGLVTVFTSSWTLLCCRAEAAAKMSDGVFVKTSHVKILNDRIDGVVNISDQASLLLTKRWHFSTLTFDPRRSVSDGNDLQNDKKIKHFIYIFFVDCFCKTEFYMRTIFYIKIYICKYIF